MTPDPKKVEEIARWLDHGAQDMLLHIARIRPMPKPFPPQSVGRRRLAQLMYADLLIDIPISPGFVCNELGFAVAQHLKASANG